MAALAVSGCGGSSQSAVRPAEIASDAGTQAVAQLDANQDGSLDYKELAKAPGLRAAVATIKKLARFRGPPPSQSQLQSATITADEIDARIQEWKNHPTGQMTVACFVARATKKGVRGGSKPIAGAEVRFVPECFLGPSLSTGTGKTDSHGVVSVGLSPGFYRVEITKGNEIPAKYNSATELGIEVAADSLQLSSGRLTFELEY